MLDTIIRGGLVIDGTGAPGFRADVGILDGKIAAVGDLTGREARQAVNADGLTVTPGFIDIHRHADAAAFRPGFGAAELCQGLTTIVNGNCGLSCAPFGAAHGQAIRDYLRPITGGDPGGDGHRVAGGVFRVARRRCPCTWGMLAGAGVLRADAAGYELEHLESGHYRAIHRALERALGDGALGVSLGLGYAPECFYTTAELIRAFTAPGRADVPLTVHMRQEGGGVCQSVEEMLLVARELRIPLHISHLKAMGRDNWGTKIPRALALLESARREGLDVSCDVYPSPPARPSCCTSCRRSFWRAAWTRWCAAWLTLPSGRRWRTASRTEAALTTSQSWPAGTASSSAASTVRRISRFLGKSVAEEAEIEHKTPLDACCDLLIREHCQVTMIDFMASEADIAAILHDPYSSLISDATYPTEGQPHPRVYGSCTRLLEHFVRETGDADVGAGRSQADGCAGGGAAAAGKGLLAQGADADVCVFDPEKLHERGDVSAAPADGGGHGAGAGGRSGGRPGRTADRREAPDG